MKTTILYAYILYYICITFLIYTTFIGIPIWDGFFYWLWKNLNDNNVKFGYLIFILLESFFTLIPTLFYSRSSLKKEKQVCTDNIALIIPSHKAEQIIKDTLECALKVFNAKNIYVIDNGNCDIPMDNTSKICEEIGVNYKWVPIGGKLSAIYIGTILAKKYEFIMQIDDDIFLNENMTFPIDIKTECIAYVIGACNNFGNKTIIHYMQDIEYKHAGIIKGFQSIFNAVIFAHGAISLWRRSTLINVLENHPIYSISDDWFTGFKSNELGYKIDVCDRNFIYTDVPSSFFSGSRQGGYGNVSLFSQRFHRWYITYLIQIFYILYYCIFSWKLPLRIILIQKVFFLWDIFNSLLNFLKIYVFIVYIIYDWKFTLIIYFICIGLNLLELLIFNYCQLRNDERLPLWVIFIYPIYSIYDGIVFCLSILYSIWVNPTILFHKGENLMDNEKLKNIIKLF